MYLDLASNEGGKGKIANMLAKQRRKIGCDGKQKQMANKTNSSACGKAKPCGHPASRFVGETAGHIDARLILLKLHLSTFKKF